MIWHGIGIIRIERPYRDLAIGAATDRSRSDGRGRLVPLGAI